MWNGTVRDPKRMSGNPSSDQWPKPLWCHTHIQSALSLQCTLVKLQLPASSCCGFQSFYKEPWKATLLTPCSRSSQLPTLGSRCTNPPAPSLWEWDKFYSFSKIFSWNPLSVAHSDSWAGNTSFTGDFSFLAHLLPPLFFLVSLKLTICTWTFVAGSASGGIKTKTIGMCVI